jgi:hypothetical protein
MLTVRYKFDAIHTDEKPKLRQSSLTIRGPGIFFQFSDIKILFSGESFWEKKKELVKM